MKYINWLKKRIPKTISSFEEMKDKAEVVDKTTITAKSLTNWTKYFCPYYKSVYATSDKNGWLDTSPTKGELHLFVDRKLMLSYFDEENSDYLAEVISEINK